jgi:single-strand DNA-binding protein
MNKVLVTGRMVKDATINDTGNTKIAKFTVATQRNFKDKDGKYGADFILCTAFGKTAEFISKYFSKGSQICVEGRINTGSYTNKDGNKVFTTDVAVEKAEFVGSKADNESAKSEAQAKPESEGFMNIPEGTDDDLPLFG